MPQPKRQHAVTDEAPERPASPNTVRRVAILVESSTSWGRGVIRGIAEHAEAVGPWAFYLEPFGRNERLHMPRGWTGHGVIARVNSPELADEIEASGLPCVDISWFEFGNGRFARVTADEDAVGRLAAGHLLERGFREIAYLPPLGRPGYANRQGDVIRDVARAAGARFHRHTRPSEAGDEELREAELEGLLDWVRRLPKPVGIVAFGDFGARQITEAAWLAGHAVPDEVAVVGSEHDELSAIISNPPLSSVDVGARQVGVAAAEVLEAMMRGEPAPGEPLLLPPVGVIARRSTDVLAAEDPLVTEACRYMRAEAHANIVIDRVVEHCLVSRRTLEQRFLAVLGCSPAQMLRRIRLERACTALTDTDDPIPAVAIATGFGSRIRMARAFQAELGMSPQQYRETHTLVG